MHNGQIFQIEEFAKPTLSLQPGAIVDFVSVKTTKINRVHQPENFPC